MTMINAWSRPQYDLTKKHVLTFQVDYEVSIVVYFRENLLYHNNPESKDAVIYYSP